jgi:hypothetical protein
MFFNVFYNLDMLILKIKKKSEKNYLNIFLRRKLFKSIIHQIK